MTGKREMTDYFSQLEHLRGETSQLGHYTDLSTFLHLLIYFKIVFNICETLISDIPNQGIGFHLCPKALIQWEDKESSYPEAQGAEEMRGVQLSSIDVKVLCTILNHKKKLRCHFRQGIQETQYRKVRVPRLRT